jgi:prefoldin subunit 5
MNDLREFTETIECLQLNIKELLCHAPITQEQLEHMQQQIQLLTQKAEEANYIFH